MENRKLAGKLREFARSSSSSYKKQIFKQAARRIEEQDSQLEAVTALANEAQLRLACAIVDLKEVDIDCKLCVHHGPAPCNTAPDFEGDCSDCPFDCICNTCENNEKWEYRPEANRTGTTGDFIRQMIATDDALAEQLIRKARTDEGQNLHALWCDNCGGCKEDEECNDTMLKECVLRYLRKPMPVPEKGGNR